MIRTPAPSVILLALAAFLAPLIGGQVPNDVSVLEPGYVPTVQSLFKGQEIGTLQHALVALIVFAAFAYLVFKRKIIQIPHHAISGGVAALIALLIASVFMSDYRWVSQTTLAEWIIYGIALVACVAGLGRREGPVAILGALATGSTLLALIGLAEYANMRSLDPTWRIFGTWNNPNANAGMLLIGSLVSLVLCGTRKSTASNVMAGLSAALGLVALVLTGSKGGLMAFEIGLALLFLVSTLFTGTVCRSGLIASLGVTAVTLLILALGAVSPNPAVTAASVVGLVACGATAWFFGSRSAVRSWGIALAAGLVLVTLVSVSSGSGGVGGRAAGAASTQEQSSGFRKQLWKGAIELVKRNPVGEGVGTYAFHSAEPGITTRTELAHSTWLQLAVEGGVLAPLALFIAIVAWAAYTLRSSPAMPRESNLLRAGVVAAVAAIAAHGLIESNLYYFGIGLSLFLLLGVGIQLGADAGAPEFVAPPIRFVSIGLGLLCVGQLVFAGYVGKLQANLRFLLSEGKFEEATQAAADLKGIAPFDGETWYRAGMVATNPQIAVDDLRKAAEIAPSPKYLRRLAEFQVRAHFPAAAEASLERALRLDPRNLPALLQLAKLQESNSDLERAQATLNRLIAVERTPYFQIRSLPELVPTETYEGRILLAKFGSPKELLREAVEGLSRFTEVTLPRVRSGVMPGLSVSEAENKVGIGKTAAQELRKLYEESNDRRGILWVDERIRKFEEAIPKEEP